MNALVVRLVMMCLLTAVSVRTISGQSAQLTFTDALARARTNAADVIAATAAIGEARARLVGASLRLRENPEFDIDVGTHTGDSGRTAAWSVSAMQALEPRGRVSRRVAAAEAGIRTAETQVAVAALDAMAFVAAAYLDAWHRQREAAALARSEQVAAEVLRAAERRFSVGDVAVLDVNAARAERARAAAERLAAESMAATRLGDLRAVIGLAGAEPLMLADPVALATPADLASRISALDQRPDLRVLASEIEQIGTELRLAATFKQPEWAVGAQYDREEGDNVVLGGLRLRLPVFNKAQEDVALLHARAERLRRLYEARRLGLEAQLRADFEAYRLHADAVDTLERQALPATADNEALARRSYEVGQISLADWLVLRREAVQIEREFLTQRRELARLRLQLDVTSGVLQ